MRVTRRFARSALAAWLSMALPYAAAQPTADPQRVHWISELLLRVSARGLFAAALLVLVGALLLALELRRRRGAKAMHRRIRELEDTLTAREAQTESLSRRLAQTIHELELAHHRLHELEIGLARKTHLDSLTGLANRLLLNERITHGITRALRHNTRMAVLLIELEGIEPIAERFGRQAADEIRIAMAARLRGLVRAQDTVARLDDRRFAIVLEEVFDQRDVLRVIAAATSALGEAVPLGDASMTLDVPIGYAFYPEHGRDASALLASAANMLPSAGAGRATLDVG